MKAKLIAILLITAIAIILMYVLPGCSSSKHTNSTKRNSELNKEINIDSVKKIAERTAQLKLEEKIKKTMMDIQFFQTDNDKKNKALKELEDQLRQSGNLNDTLQQSIDALMKLPCNEGGKIKVNVDGSLEASNVKSYIKQIDSWQQKYDSLMRIKKSSDSLHRSQQETKKESATEKHIDKKTTWFPWWLLIVAYVLGVFFPPMKIIALIKSSKK